MSENTVNAALRRLGYTKQEMTGHGFRSMASTLLNEQGWHRDAVERQLAHAERDSIRAAYNRAEHLPERKKMMQAWADYLDKLASGAKVVPVLGATGAEVFLETALVSPLTRRPSQKKHPGTTRTSGLARIASIVQDYATCV